MLCEWFILVSYLFSLSPAQVDYRLGFQVENTSAMDQPQSNISAQGEVPRTRSGKPNISCCILKGKYAVDIQEHFILKSKEWLYF